MKQSNEKLIIRNKNNAGDPAKVSVYLIKGNLGLVIVLDILALSIPDEEQDYKRSGYKLVKLFKGQALYHNKIIFRPETLARITEWLYSPQ